MSSYCLSKSISNSETDEKTRARGLRWRLVYQDVRPEMGLSELTCFDRRFVSTAVASWQPISASTRTVCPRHRRALSLSISYKTIIANGRPVCPDPSITAKDGKAMVDRVVEILSECETIWPLASRWLEGLRKFMAADHKSAGVVLEGSMADGVGRVLSFYFVLGGC